MTYQAQDPKAFLVSQGWAFRQSARELVTTCPLCGKQDHLYVNAYSGLWKCHRCGEAGNLYQLRQRLGVIDGRPHHTRPSIERLGQALGSRTKRIALERVEAMHAALMVDSEALEYATKTRRWALEVVKRMKIGLRTDARGKWLAFPWMVRDQCHGIKFRILPAYQDKYPQRFDREPGCESVLYNADALDAHDEVIVASGESDALALMTLGFSNVVATTTGESGLPAFAVDLLTKKQRVLLPFDNDQAGQEGVRKVAKRLGFDKTYLVRLPDEIHDVNEFVIRGGTRQQFEAMLAAATQFDVPTIVSVSQALDRLEAEKTVGDWDALEQMTPWPSVNRRLGLWRGGNLIVVGAPQGTGKTTWVLNVCMWWAQQGFPVCFYCLEMGVDELVQHIICAHYQIAEDEVTQEIISKARQDLATWPLYLGSNPRATGRNDVMDLLAQATRRYGLRLLAFDNLHMLARSIEHRVEEVGVLTKGFKLFAMEHEIPVLLIAQPRKLVPGKIMTPWDLKDSVDIYSDADQVILLHREAVGATKDTKAVAAANDGEPEIMSPLTLIRLAKARHRASRDGLLYFVGDQHRFREIESGDVPAKTTSSKRSKRSAQEKTVYRTENHQE